MRDPEEIGLMVVTVVEKYLCEIFCLLTDEATVKSIGTYLDVEQSVIESCELVVSHEKVPNSPLV